MQARRILLTGGAGFLGRAILREWARDPAGAPDAVRVLDLAAEGVTDSPVPVEAITGDIRDAALVREACRDVDAVIHSASMVDWGHTSPEELLRVNVGATRGLLDACRDAGVPRFVYTSTMDVVCGTAPVVQADESTPYPEEFTNHYARTKALAEQAVLAAHGSKRAARDGEDPAGASLATCALRPCGMYGEYDPYHVANVLRVVKDGNLPFRLGDGKAVFEHVYVGNVARANRLAVERLDEPGSAIGGRAYFITDDSPTEDFLEFMEHVLEPLGYRLPPRTRRVPYPVILAVAAAAEAAAWLCRPFFRFTPTLTRSSVRFVCHEHSFDGSAARRDLGYEPVFGPDEALARTIEYFRRQETP
jgi:nucleoside-diphosphate-sugar epimerase